MADMAKEIKKEEKKLEKDNEKPKLCILCEKESAQFCVKGLPNTCYCRDCALKQFKQLNYLEKL